MLRRIPVERGSGYPIKQNWSSAKRTIESNACASAIRASLSQDEYACSSPTKWLRLEDGKPSATPASIVCLHLSRSRAKVNPKLSVFRQVSFAGVHSLLG